MGYPVLIVCSAEYRLPWIIMNHCVNSGKSTLFDLQGFCLRPGFANLAATCRSLGRLVRRTHQRLADRLERADRASFGPNN